MFQQELSIFIDSKKLTKEFFDGSICLPDTNITFLDHRSGEDDKPIDSLVICDCSDMTETSHIIKKLVQYHGDYKAVIIQAHHVEMLYGRKVPDDNTELWCISGKAEMNRLTLRSYFGRVMVHMKEVADHRKERICMETAFDSIPDLAWFKDLTGAHLMVNQGFCSAVQKSKEQIYKKQHYFIWDIPKEEYKNSDYVCLESEQEVIDAGKTCLIDEKVKTKNGMRKFKTYKTPLYDKDGSLFGTCGIAQDITEFGNLTNELIVIMNSMSFAVVVENSNGVIMSVNRQFCEYFPQYMNIEGYLYADWKAESEKSGVIIENNKEIRVISGNKERILCSNEEPVLDVFGQHLGVLHIFRDVTMERQYEKQMEDYANTDFMTGLNNRRSLFNYLKMMSCKEQLSFLLIDLDNFKNVNDCYGHHAGDEAILLASEVIKNFFCNDFSVRLGGDEFLIVIDGELSVEELRQKAQSFLKKLIGSFLRKQQFKNLTASIGISVSYGSEQNPHDMDRVMRNSDKALYCAKNTGKSRVCVFQ